MSGDREEALRVDIYAEIGYHLGIDDSDDGACDAKNAATNAVLQLLDRELSRVRDAIDQAHTEADEMRRQLLDETYRPEGGEIVMRELGRVKSERDAAVEARDEAQAVIEKLRSDAEVRMAAMDAAHRVLGERCFDEDESTLCYEVASAVTVALAAALDGSGVTPDA